MIKEFWEKLDKKQRYYVASAAILILIALILEFALFPFWDAKGRIKQALQTNQKKLSEIISMDNELTALEAKAAKVKRVMMARPADFSLFSYVEKKAVIAAVKGNIKNMSSSRGTQMASFEESLIDIRLDKITIKQLTNFLYYAESPADLVRIKRISVTKMKESPEYLSVQMQLASFQMQGARPGGR
jgi:general secretion pathway protein M